MSRTQKHMEKHNKPRTSVIQENYIKSTSELLKKEEEIQKEEN